MYIYVRLFSLSWNKVIRNVRAKDKHIDICIVLLYATRISTEIYICTDETMEDSDKLSSSLLFISLGPADYTCRQWWWTCNKELRSVQIFIQDMIYFTREPTKKKITWKQTRERIPNRVKRRKGWRRLTKREGSKQPNTTH